MDKPAIRPLAISIKDKAVLYAAYMPFLKSGGLFIPTKKAFAMGQEVSMVVTLMDDPDKYPVSGKVIWVTPVEAQGNRAAGFGFEFTGSQGEVLRGKIETILAASLKSEQVTHSM